MADAPAYLPKLGRLSAVPTWAGGRRQAAGGRRQAVLEPRYMSTSLPRCPRAGVGFRVWKAEAPFAIQNARQLGKRQRMTEWFAFPSHFTSKAAEIHGATFSAHWLPMQRAWSALQPTVTSTDTDDKPSISQINRESLCVAPGFCNRSYQAQLHVEHYLSIILTPAPLRAVAGL